MIQFEMDGNEEERKIRCSNNKRFHTYRIFDSNFTCSFFNDEEGFRFITLKHSNLLRHDANNIQGVDYYITDMHDSKFSVFHEGQLISVVEISLKDSSL